MKRLVGLLLFLVIVGTLTASIQEPPANLKTWVLKRGIQRVYSREGHLINFNYHNGLNTTHWLDLFQIPVKLQNIFILAEDQEFYRHGGVDWKARLSALGLNFESGRVLRGASTITEQVVRLIHPRKRTFFSKIIETFESWWLECKVNKAELLEFYLNQVPYASQRRGILQASLFYFDRSLRTLNLKEQLALAVLIRSPSSLDLYKYPNKIASRINALADRALRQGLINREERLSIDSQKLTLQKNRGLARPWAFLNFIEAQRPRAHQITTTLDRNLQLFSEDLLHQSVKKMNRFNVTNGAALVVDRRKGDILAYAVSGKRDQDIEGAFYDVIQVPRQPGSTLKPFLYALAFENGRVAADVVVDEPLTESVGHGLHEWNNYSGRFYGEVSLREALANSLNIPSVKLITDIGVATFLSFLKSMNISGLDKGAEFYGKGLALGNAEISLFELVQAYTTLANQGKQITLRWNLKKPLESRQTVLSKESTSLISDILSDPTSRRWEFGESSLFSFPSQTAIKTGTSTAYRDAWLIGFNDDFVVGVWMGNLNHRKMDEITGSRGPAMVVKGLFKKLHEIRPAKGLYLSPKLVSRGYCRIEGELQESCEGQKTRLDWFPIDFEVKDGSQISSQTPGIAFPHADMILALDPRIKKESQVIFLELSHQPKNSKVRWLVDAVEISGNQWMMVPGTHQVKAQVIKDDDLLWESSPRAFKVVQ